jgi:hypothetical protein
MQQSGNTLTAQAELDSPPPLQNAVEQVVSEQFSDPTLWTEVQAPRMGAQAWLAGIHYQDGAPGRSGEASYTLENPDREWVALLYGNKVDVTPDGSASFRATDLETLCTIHDTLAETVLKGEHVHPSVLVIPTKPAESIRNEANNDIWLEAIAEGKWPVMAEKASPQGEKDYSSHDYSDYHTATMMLMPRNAQDLMSKAAALELDWRKRYRTGEVPEVLKLPGDDYRRTDPFASGLRGSQEYEGAIMKIDSLTDIAGYVTLLNYSMQPGEGSARDRLEELAGYITDDGLDSNTPQNLRELTADLYKLQRGIGDLLNYVTRQETHQNTTPEAMAAESRAFLEGMVRITERLRGTYVMRPEDYEPAQIKVKPYREPEPELASEIETQVISHDTTSEFDTPAASESSATKTSERPPLSARLRRLVMRRTVEQPKQPEPSKPTDPYL